MKFDVQFGGNLILCFLHDADVSSFAGEDRIHDGPELVYPRRASALCQRIRQLRGLHPRSVSNFARLSKQMVSTAYFLGAAHLAYFRRLVRELDEDSYNWGAVMRGISSQLIFALAFKENLKASMQTTMPTNQRVNALAVQATEFKQHSDNCSGQSESWSELNLDKFARMFVEECVSVVEQHCLGDDQRPINLKSLKMALRAHFGTQ